MRKHGWQLPYHPLQVVAVAVFMALGFAYYVFFAPFVGKKLFQYIAMGIYTPLIISVFSLYIWCAAADPADPGVFKSKKYLKTKHNHKHTSLKESRLGMDSSSSIQDANSLTNPTPESNKMALTSPQTKRFSCLLALLLPCTSICHSSSSNESLMSEDGMFCCSLCEVEVYKYSKHCRVCDKCVDHFDHHCRWINNCIGKKNYRKFFTLMVSALFLLIIQWSTGILVLILCFLERKKFSLDIASNLGSSFTVAPFVIVVAICTILAMIASFPLAQLFFFHILLVKKGISTYDYIIALREQEQGNGVQQSPQLSQASSLTGLSSASSFNTFHRAAWCTPPRLFVEDQFDVVPTETGSVSSLGKKPVMEEPVVKKAVKISPWTLAKLNTEEVTKAASEARKKSKILQPIAAKRQTPYTMETGSTSRRVINRLENNRKRSTKRIRLPTELPFEPSDNNNISMNNTSSSLAFRTHGIIASSSESSLESPDLPPFQISAPIPLSRSTSDGYDASGGEDSDRVSSRFVQRSANWSSLLFGSEHNRVVRN